MMTEKVRCIAGIVNEKSGQITPLNRLGSVKMEKLKTLIQDIQDMMDKLLHVATKENQDKKEIRQMRNILRDKIATYDTIKRAKEIVFSERK